GADSKRPSVQVGNPFLEKLLLEATLELVAADAVEAVQDLGAAGLTCATSEVAAKSGVGMRIDVARVPRRASAMTPHEVMLSESQERMLVVARPGREADVERIFARWELHGARIGEVTAGAVLAIFDGEERVAELPPRALADQAPEYDISALAGSYRGPDEGVGGAAGVTPSDEAPAQVSTGKIGLELLELMASPAVASRRAIYRTYDQMVATDTVMGPGADAAVMRIKGRPDGIAVAIDAQPRVAAIDPFVGAASAVAEATRNLVRGAARRPRGSRRDRSRARGAAPAPRPRRSRSLEGGARPRRGRPRRRARRDRHTRRRRREADPARDPRDRQTRRPLRRGT